MEGYCFRYFVSDRRVLLLYKSLAGILSVVLSPKKLQFGGSAGFLHCKYIAKKGEANTVCQLWYSETSAEIQFRHPLSAQIGESLQYKTGKF